VSYHPITFVAILKLAHHSVWERQARTASSPKRVTISGPSFGRIGIVAVAIPVRYSPVPVMDDEFGTLVPTYLATCVDCALFRVEVATASTCSIPPDIPSALGIRHYMVL